MICQRDRAEIQRDKHIRAIPTYGIEPVCSCNYCAKTRKRLKANNMTKKYNKAGLEPRRHYQECDDPCGYVTDSPNLMRVAINETVDAALQRVYEIREKDESGEPYRRALVIYNLIREMAASAGRKTDGELPLIAARIKKVFSAL